jgi:hypothetical protein
MQKGEMDICTPLDCVANELMENLYGKNYA